MRQKPKILIAPDSFKGSISAEDAANAIARGLAKNPALSAPELWTVPIADGGEGTLSALVPHARQIIVSVTGTGGNQIEAAYGYIEKTAIIEMARAAGLTLVPEGRRSVLSATTLGVGELIKDALDRGFRDFLLTVGGSGTNDGGCGMFAALGADFITNGGVSFLPTGASLHKVAHISTDRLDPRLKNCRFTIATDVKNPLLGPEGATYVYAKQKGCHDNELPEMEAGMRQYAAVLQRACGKDVAIIPGCGAGGGISAPLLGFCGAAIRSGIDAVLEAVRFDRLLEGADAVITGEGKIDRQSLYGKAISGVANAAKSAGVPVYCLVGCIGDDKKALMEMGLTDILALQEIAPDAAYSMAHASELLEQLAAAMRF
ncbi:MAG: glycerate kinase [Ruminococcaceae bacterium]|nr:glycerate kinase [Oscillospiraceae bacterium]